VPGRAGGCLAGAGGGWAVASPAVLYLVRHGRTAQNAARLLLGRMDVPLDELGRRQAAALGTVPELNAAARVVSSPLARAFDTASALGPAVTVDERWIEIDYGTFDGAELTAAGELWEGWDRDLEYRPPEGESLADLGRRVRGACDQLWEEAAGRDVVVVSHVSPIKAAVAWALGVGDDVQWRMFLDTASITVIGPGRRGPTLRSFNQTVHRPGS
jgi:alpha-ribazole phosphatase